MASILFQVTHGPEAQSRVALAFLVARTAVAEGHDVIVFLAAEGVTLLRDPVMDGVTGLGLGNVREHHDAIVAGGGKIYASRMSSVARDIDVDGLSERVTFARPEDLVRLIVEHDKVLTY